MKKIYYILFLLILPLVGCSDFLEQDNKSNVPRDQFYGTATGYNSLMNTVYSSLRAIYGIEPWIFCAGTDLYASGRNKVPDGLGTYKGLLDSDPDVKKFYTNCYAGIQLANTAIYYADHTETTNLLGQYKAEARFIRAYYYYLLVQNFGGVALVKDMIDSPVVTFERKSATDTYAFIISEMEDLKSSLPAKTPVFGRVDQRTVNHFLAKTYLCRGYETFGTAADFTKAAEYADAAINNQALSTSFNNLFWPDQKYEQDDEVIWSVQYDESSIATPTSGNMQQAFFGTYLGGVEDGNKYTTSTLTPTIRLHQLFSKGDTRYEGTFMVQFYTHYYDFYTKSKQLDTEKVLYYYPPAWQVADTAAWRAANPATRSKTVIIPMQENTLTVSGKPTTYIAAMSGDVYGVAVVRKFDDPTSVFSTTGSTRDIILARVGESYLVAAEAYYKAGNTDKAVERINVVRKRAAAAGYDMSIKASDVSIDFILDERARELAGEYHRWMDLKRTGKLIEYAVKYNPNIIGADYFKGVDGQNKILRPIPLDAINLNQAKVEQNPGY